MLQYKYAVISPYIREVSRINALMSGYDYGSTSLEDDHHLNKLNLFLEFVEKPNSYDYLAKVRNREFPNLSRRNVLEGEKTYSDIMLKDNFRQNLSIEEKFRNHLPSSTDIRNISDPMTKLWKSGSRGYELYLVNLFNNLDRESFNRKSIKPILI